MPIQDTQEFINELEKHGELKRVKTEVDQDLEIAEILRREMYSNGPAILFENVKGHSMPVLGNAFGSMKRLEIGLEMTDFTEIGHRITDMTKMDMPSGFLNKIKKLPELSKMTASFPKMESSGLVTEVTSTDASFDDLPSILDTLFKSLSFNSSSFFNLNLFVVSSSVGNGSPNFLSHTFDSFNSVLSFII